jgi:cell division protein FtsQ
MTTTDFDTVLSDDEVLAGEDRFVARRAEVDAARRERRRAMLVLVAGAVIAVVLVVFAIMQSGYIDVQSVRVVGAERTDARAVLAAARVRVGAPMIGLPASQAAERIESLAWVQHATVERHWPHDVVIRVHEYEAAAWFRLTPSTVALLGRDGRVLAHARRAPPGLDEVTGVRVAPAIGSLLDPPGLGRVAEALPAALASRLASIDVAGEGVRLLLRDGPVIELGNLDQIALKAQAALGVLDQRQHANQTTTVIDVSVPAAPTARSS